VTALLAVALPAGLKVKLGVLEEMLVGFGPSSRWQVLTHLPSGKLRASRRCVSFLFVSLSNSVPSSSALRKFRATTGGWPLALEWAPQLSSLRRQHVPPFRAVGLMMKRSVLMAPTLRQSPLRIPPSLEAMAA
jgi:hypothetical protein